MPAGETVDGPAREHSPPDGAGFTLLNRRVIPEVKSEQEDGRENIALREGEEF